jgi:hypothetical protein
MQQIAYLIFLFLLNIKQQYVNMISVFLATYSCKNSVCFTVKGDIITAQSRNMKNFIFIIFY